MLKQRLVGAAVIIALAVVLIPMILDGAGLHVVPDIPDKPPHIKNRTSKPIVVVTDRIPVFNKDADTKQPKKSKFGIHAKKVAKESENNKEPVKTSPPDDTNVTKSARGTGWSVQIARFNGKSSAEVLKRKVSKAGFKVYILEASGKQANKVYHVYVGPEENQTKARQLQTRLKQEIMLNGLVTQSERPD